MRPLAIGALLAVACTHDRDHEGPVTSTGGEGMPCAIEDASTGSEALDGVFEWTLAPGVVAEINVDLGDDGFMHADFDAAGIALDWDIHTHDGEQVVVLDSGKGVAGAAELHAPAAGLYSFYWRNGGSIDATLCVELTLDGTAALHPM